MMQMTAVTTKKPNAKVLYVAVALLPCIKAQRVAISCQTVAMTGATSTRTHKDPYTKALIPLVAWLGITSFCLKSTGETKPFSLVDRSYGTQRAGSLGSSGSLWEDAHIASRYQPVPTNPRNALSTLSTTERPLNIDQAKSANAQSENASTIALPLKLPRLCFFVSLMTKD
jgi:hypothetical protein